MASSTEKVRQVLNIDDKRGRIALFLASSLIILGTSVLVYGGVVVEQQLIVFDNRGPNAGSVPTTSYTTSTILLLLALAITVGLAVFGFVREAYRHVKTKKQEDLHQTTKEIASEQDDGWEEAPKKKEDEYSRES